MERHREAPAPRLKARYWRDVRARAAALGSDGCTAATERFHDCCLRHDIEYRTGRIALGMRRLTRAEADRRFLRCMQARSPLGRWTPLGWLRYAAVRVFGGHAWRGGP